MVQILLLLIYISDILLTPLIGVHPLLIILPAIIATMTLYFFLKRVSTRTSCCVATVIVVVATVVLAVPLEHAYWVALQRVMLGQLLAVIVLTVMTVGMRAVQH
ncbi:hypothetical protein EFL87_04530 [Weissella confusa]|uniref:hypothetical protein n=1 Tax=Weissella confusa TaxID=1583 RepID=UPI00223C0545|nr:hypothetical protein [Weissella confusa]MCT0041756.1 hypothetical protein [Weissella confusa]